MTYGRSTRHDMFKRKESEFLLSVFWQKIRMTLDSLTAEVILAVHESAFTLKHHP